jgi:hypothetical protein
VSIITRTPWTRQPQYFTRLAPEIPLGSFVYVPPLGLLLPGGRSFAVERTTLDRNPTAGGISENGTATTSRATLGLMQRARTSVGLTIVAQFVSSTTATRYIAGTVNTGTAYLEDVGVNLNASEVNSANRVLLNIRTQSGAGTSSRFGSTDAILSQGSLHTVVWEFRGGASCRLWLDGAEKALTTTASAFAEDTDALTEFPNVALNRNVRNAFSNGGTGLNLVLYSRIFGVGFDCARISSNPWWQLFAPLPRRIWAPPAAGGAAPTLSDLKATNITSSSVQFTYDYTF